MKSVFEEYHALWPKTSHAALEPYLSKVPVVHYPADRDKLGQVLAHYVVIVVKKAELREIVSLLEMGFEHIVQAGREDFAHELLASALMVVRPDAFMKNPIPFFFSGFHPPQGQGYSDKNLLLRFHRSAEKPTLLEWLGAFLDKNDETRGIRDLCLQAADEMISNAIFNAPVRPGGLKPFQNLPRDSTVELPVERRATLFATFSERRVILGCSDTYGSLAKEPLLAHMRALFKEKTSSARGGTGGAGLGFKYLVENSANFYVLASRTHSTLIACGFLLKGLRANLTTAKHFHFSFR